MPQPWAWRSLRAAVLKNRRRPLRLDPQSPRPLAASSDAEASVPETNEKESAEAAAAGKESSGGSGDGTVIRVGGLKGPTTMGLVKLMDDAENGKAQNDYEFTMVTAADRADSPGGRK